MSLCRYVASLNQALHLTQLYIQETQEKLQRSSNNQNTNNRDRKHNFFNLNKWPGSASQTLQDEVHCTVQVTTKAVKTITHLYNYLITRAKLNPAKTPVI